MDRQEYREFLDELKHLFEEHNYEGVIARASEVGYTHIRDARALEIVSDSYSAIGRDEMACNVLRYVYEKINATRIMAYKLAMLSIKLGNPDAAVGYYEDFCRMAPGDSSRLILKYEIGKAGGIPKEQLVKILESYISQEKDDKYEFELAVLYHELGRADDCVRMCDDIFLWFAKGEYVKKALQYKNMHTALTKSQQERYEQMMMASIHDLPEDDEEKPDEEASQADAAEEKDDTIFVRMKPSEYQAMEESSENGAKEEEKKEEQIEDTMVLPAYKVIDEIENDEVYRAEEFLEKAEFQPEEPDSAEESRDEEEPEEKMNAEGLAEEEPEAEPAVEKTPEEILAMDENTKSKTITMDELKKVILANTTVASPISRGRKGAIYTLSETINISAPEKESLPEEEPVQYEDQFPERSGIRKLGNESLELSEYVSQVTRPEFKAGGPEKIRQQPRLTENVDVSELPMTNGDDGQIGLNLEKLAIREAAIEGQLSIDEMFRRYSEKLDSREEENSRLVAERVRMIQEEVNRTIVPRQLYDLDEFDVEEAEIDVGSRTSVGNIEWSGVISTVELESPDVASTIESQIAATAATISAAMDETAAREKPAIVSESVKAENTVLITENIDEMIEADQTLRSPEEVEEGAAEEKVPEEDAAADKAVHIGDTALVNAPYEIAASEKDIERLLDEENESIPDLPTAKIASIFDIDPQDLEIKSAPESDAEAEPEPEGIAAGLFEPENEAEPSELSAPESESEEKPEPEGIAAGLTEAELAIAAFESNRADHAFSDEDLSDMFSEIGDEIAALALDLETDEAVEEEEEPEGAEELPTEPEETIEEASAETEETVEEATEEIPAEETADETAGETEEAAEEAVQEAEEITSEAEEPAEETAQEAEETVEEATEEIPAEDTADETAGETEEAAEEAAQEAEEITAETETSAEKTGDTDEPADKIIRDYKDLETEMEERFEKFAGEEETAESVDTPDAEEITRTFEENIKEYEKEGRAMSADELSAAEKAIAAFDRAMEEKHRPYALKDDVREELSEFMLIDGMEEQIAAAIGRILSRKRKGDITGGNLVITGDAKSGKTFLAVAVIKAVAGELQSGNGKVAKVQAQALNGKDVSKVFEKIGGSDLIIENVGYLSDETIVRLTECIRSGKNGGMVIFEGNQLAVENIFANFPETEKLFATRIDINELGIIQWADLACNYAEEQGYRIDDLALLALHAKINEINLPTVRIGFEDITGIVDSAIEKAERRNVGKLFSSKSHKNDGELKSLTESDFS